jgi:hypothetical protein
VAEAEAGFALSNSDFACQARQQCREQSEQTGVWAWDKRSAPVWVWGDGQGHRLHEATAAADAACAPLRQMGSPPPASPAAAPAAPAAPAALAAPAGELDNSWYLDQLDAKSHLVLESSSDSLGHICVSGLWR